MKDFSRLLLTALLTLCSYNCANSGQVHDGANTDSRENGIVLVAGATGRTGQLVVKQLLAHDYSVRALVRDPAKAKERLPASVSIHVADVRDPAAVAAAIVGVEDVISAIGSVSPSGPNSPEFVDYGGVRNLVQASVAAGIDQFVLVSSLSTTKPDHPLNEEFGDVLIWKNKGENVLRDSGLDYTIVRPGGLRDTPGRQGALLVDQGDRIETGYVSREDLAEICVAALSYDSARKRTFEVIGEPGSTARPWAALFERLYAD